MVLLAGTTLRFTGHTLRSKEEKSSEAKLSKMLISAEEAWL